MSEQRFYSEDEAQQLLRMAAQSTPTSGMSREELVRAAGELGIPEERILEAESQLVAEREASARAEQDKALRAEFERYYRRKILSQAWGAFSGASIWIMLWAFTGMGYFWPIWVVGWWVVPALGSLVGSLLDPTHKQKAYEKWLAHRNGEPLPSLAEGEESDHDHGYAWSYGFGCSRGRWKRRDWSERRHRRR